MKQSRREFIGMSAMAAGVKGAYCTYGFSEERDARSDARIDRFGELLDVLK